MPITIKLPNKHIGRCAYRTSGDHEEARREKVFANEWSRMNARAPGILNSLSGEEPVAEQEAITVATVIQWLGSPIGFAWLRETLGKAGYHIVKQKESE